MKVCPICNTQLTDDTIFCTNCGQNLTEIETNAHTNGNCPYCGMPVSNESDFCTNCGKRLTAEVAIPQAVDSDSIPSGMNETNIAQPTTQKKGLLIGGIVLLILLLSGGWYYKVYTSSPDYIVSKMVASSQKLYDDGQKTYYLDKGSITSTTGNSTEFNLITITKEGITRTNTVVLYFSHRDKNKWGWYDKKRPKELHDVSYSDFSGYAKDWLLEVNQKGKKNSDASSATSSASTSSNVSLENSQTTPRSQENILQAAQDELGQYGVSCRVVATSYGHSNDGFLAVDGSKGVRLLILDRKNHQVATFTTRNKKLRQFVQSRNKPESQSIIVNFGIRNAVRDGDASLGNWSGDTHQFPIYCAYKFDGAGNVVPGMLTSGKGANPSHYQDPLREQRSVDLANLFLTEMMTLWEDAQKRNATIE